MSEDLERSLAQLTSEQRRLVWMADVEGVSYREIAERTGTPIGTKSETTCGGLSSDSTIRNCVFP